MAKKIQAAFGGEIDYYELLGFFLNQPEQTVMIGGDNNKLSKHKYPHSLDYWLRTHGAKKRDTRQTTKEWIQDNLLSTGLFVKTKMINPDSGYKVDALRFVK